MIMKINKKIVLCSIVFLFIGALLTLSWERGYFVFGSEVERSYKTDGVEPRYLRSLNKTPFVLPPDHTDTVNITEARIQEMENLLNRAGENAQQFPWFSQIMDEHVLVVVTDLGNLRFTVGIDGGEFSVDRGFDESREPTMIVPVDSENIRSLEVMFRDGEELTYEERYRIYNILAVPALQALYRVDAYHNIPDLRAAKFDDFIQMVIPAEEDVVYRGSPIEIAVTAVNVDGQWLVFPGLQGDPDWILSLDLDTATELYLLGVYEAREADGSIRDLRNMSERFLNILDENIIYLREDHQ